MAHQDRSDQAGGDAPGAPLEHKVDVIAGAVADLERRLADVSTELTAIGPKLNELLDRHPAGLGAATDVTASVAADVANTVLEPVHASLAALTESASSQREEVLLALEVLTRVAEAIERIDDRTEDRLAAVRDAAVAPAADLHAMLAARSERLDGRLDELAAQVEELGSRPSGVSTDLGPLADRVSDLTEAVQSLSWQLPELAEEVAALRTSDEGDAPDDDGSPDAGDDLVERVTSHTDVALTGVLRLIDQRLDGVRATLAEVVPAAPPAQPVAGFEAGAVMGAAQAAWNRLEQRLDQEFDDLGRQLQTLGALVERATATAEAAANRPVVTGEQLRSAASAVRESVVRASRSRRERRGGPSGLGPGSP